MSWDHADSFREKLRRGQVCLGTVISLTDPTVTEALCPLFDFLWIDMEHSVLSLEAVQGHVMAARGAPRRRWFACPGTIRCSSSRCWTSAPRG
jgi:2-keto-3-deoxy-L-rhamnonate aldolase RhmA